MRKDILLGIIGLTLMPGCATQALSNADSSGGSTALAEAREMLAISNSLNGIVTLLKGLDVGEGRYKMDLILETYEGDRLVGEESLLEGQTFHVFDGVRTVFVDKLFLAVKRSDDKGAECRFLFGNNWNRVGRTLQIDEKYRRPFGLKDFEMPAHVRLGESIPFALYGAFWEFDFQGGKALRFCSSDAPLASRADTQICGRSPFYFVFSYRLSAESRQ